MELMLSELKIHETECTYRLVTCPRLLCETKISLSELLNHIDEKHNFTKIEEMPLIRVTEAKNWTYLTDDTTLLPLLTTHIVLENRHFFTEGFWYATTGLLYRWVYFMGTQNEADCYNYTMKFTTGDKVIICREK